MLLKSQPNLLTNTTKILIISLLVIGIYFRFTNLDRKVYWQDEVVTSLRTAGYTWTEMNQELFKERLVSVGDLQKYQHLNSERGLSDTISGLSIEEPQHPPLYYTIARYWEQWWGNAVSTRRTLPAMISLLVLPGIYWLCRELFESPATGWVAMGLIAISPFHVLYAQENREYSLWTVTILLASVALLRAIRSNTKLSWSIYAITVILGFYTFLLSGLVFIGHGIYLLAIENFQRTKRVTAYLLAMTAGFASIIPWLMLVLQHKSAVSGTTNWMTARVSATFLAKLWSLDTNCIFFDLDRDGEIVNLSNSGLTLTSFIYLIITASCIALVTYSIYFLYHNTSPKIWLFILTLIGVMAICLVLPDLILGGRRSGVSRYLIPIYLGIQISTAYLLATKLTSLSWWSRRIGSIILFTLIVGGIYSDTLGSQADSWWSKIDSSNIPMVARIIDRSKDALVLTESTGVDIANVISLSYLVNPTVKFRFMADNTQIDIPKNKNLFLLNPSPKLLKKIQNLAYTSGLVDAYKSSVWQFEKNLYLFSMN